MRSPVLILLTLPLLFASACMTTSPEALMDDQEALDTVYAALLRKQILYSFEHECLPGTWFKAATELTQLIRESGSKPVQDILGYVATNTGIQAKKTGKTVNFEVSSRKDQTEIQVELFNRSGEKNITGWLVKMPTPDVSPECSYVLMFFDGSRIRYFTCEYDTLSDRELWYVCEWTDEGKHISIKTIKSGDRESFTQTVCDLVDAEPAEKAPTFFPEEQAK